MLGDEEVFVIPRDGKPTWFPTGGSFRNVEWLKAKPIRPDSAPATDPKEPRTMTGEWSGVGQVRLRRVHGPFEENPAKTAAPSSARPRRRSGNEWRGLLLTIGEGLQPINSVQWGAL